ncbi:MAG: hypothetical protein IPL40_14530 [Proteobacteria bacterium]|nr:hypothetical protein [Pseudomonadota bacterium]
MGRRHDGGGARTAFGDFDGQVEVDLPPAAGISPPVEERRPLARVGTRKRALMRRPSLVGPVLWVLLVAGALGAAYYGYCRYRVADRQQAFARELAGLRSALLALPPPLTPDDVRALLARDADRASLRADPSGIEASVEPLSAASAPRLSDAVERERGLSETATGARVPGALVVGIKARFVATYGLVSEAFGVERFVRIDSAPAGDAKSPPAAP